MVLLSEHPLVTSCLAWELESEPVRQPTQQRQGQSVERWREVVAT